MSPQVFWHAPDGRPEIIDLARIDADGEPRGLHSGESLPQLRRRYEGARLSASAQYRQAQEDAYRSAPQPCSEQAFLEALECLPPLDWKSRNGIESFKMSEFYCDGITTIYARDRVAGHCWTFRDVHTLSPEQIAVRIQEARQLLGVHGCDSASR